MKYEIKVDSNSTNQLSFNDGSMITYKLFQIENGFQMSIEESTNPYFSDIIASQSYITFDGIGDHFDFGNDSLFLIR